MVWLTAGNTSLQAASLHLRDIVNVATSPQFVIILCAVYSPPRSRKKSELTDYISDTYHHLKSSKYPSAFFALGGDINDLNVDLLLNISPKFRQIVDKPTRGNKTLSVIVSDLWEYYTSPEILPPIQPDIPGIGKPSDHSAPYARTYTDRRRPKQKNFSLKTVRPYPDSGIAEFGRWIQAESFEAVSSALTSTDKVSAFEKVISDKVEEIFPQKEIREYLGDKEFMTNQLKVLRRRKPGNTGSTKNLQNSFNSISNLKKVRRQTRRLIFRRLKNSKTAIFTNSIPK